MMRDRTLPLALLMTAAAFLWWVDAEAKAQSYEPSGQTFTYKARTVSLAEDTPGVWTATWAGAGGATFSATGATVAQATANAQAAIDGGE